MQFQFWMRFWIIITFLYSIDIMARKSTVANKMLAAVLIEPGLQKFGEYDSSEIADMTVDDAIRSDNPTIHAVGVIISRLGDGATVKEVYNEVSEYLKNNI